MWPDKRVSTVPTVIDIYLFITLRLSRALSSCC